MNVSTAPLNATFFSVTWEPVPPGHNHGIILGYKVLLENMEDTSLVLTAIVNVNQTWIMLKESSKSASILCARVVAFTSKGDGQSSTCNEVWTWSEGKLFYGSYRRVRSVEQPSILIIHHFQAFYTPKIGLFSNGPPTVFSVVSVKVVI